MSDLAQSNVHGPVETLRTEFAEWDPSAQAWGSAKLQGFLLFLPNGRLQESRDPNGRTRITWVYDEAGRLVEQRFQGDDRAVTRVIYAYDDSGRLLRTVHVDEKGTRSESETYRYDSGGRKTKIRFLPKFDGSVAYSYDGEGAGALMMSGTSAKTMTTSYDDHSQPAEILVHDDTHRLLRRMTFTYDSAGRLLKEEVHADAEARFPDFEETMKDASPEDRERLLTTLRKIFGPDHGMWTTVYAYDEKGRRIEKTRRMGALSEEHTKYTFDDHDNPIDEITENTGRDMAIDERGNLVPGKESSGRQHTRYSYTYDALGNWTERLVWSILQPATDFQRSNIERRQITYYPATPP